MFCSFDTSPRIMRFFCKGRVIEWDQPEFELLLKRMGNKMVEGARAVILLDVFKVCQTRLYHEVDCRQRSSRCKHHVDLAYLDLHR